MARDREFLQMYREQLANVPLFSGLSDRELRSLAKRAEQVSVAKGTALVTEGRIGVEFFVILVGSREGHATAGDLAQARNRRLLRRARVDRGHAETGDGDYHRAERSHGVGAPRLSVALLDEFPGVTRKLLISLAAWVSRTED